jgi:hypothetical protein
VADRFYLNLWFPSFTENEMMPRTLSVLQSFPYSAAKPGIRYVAVRAVDLSEPLVTQETFPNGADPNVAIALASEFLHDDNAYEFEACWDLWVPGESNQTWRRQPSAVRFLVHGTGFEDGIYQEAGHIQVDFGLDTPFLYEELDLTPAAEEKVRVNVQTLVSFTSALEKQCGISGRLLWSESEENLAQKLIARLQRVH